MGYFRRFKWKRHLANLAKNETAVAAVEEVIEAPINTVIEADDGTQLKKNTKGAWEKADIAENAVVQCVTKYVTSETSYSAPANGGNTIMSIMDAYITPKYANSKIMVTWELQGEGTGHNLGFRVYKDGAAAPHGRQTSSAYAFYASDNYDGNEDSTPRRCVMTYWDEPNTTSEVRYSVAVGSSNTSAYTYRNNRTAGSGGANNHETGVSTIVIWEIKQ